jgi:COMPASS component SPP1
VETHGDGAAGNGAAEEEGTAALTASLQAQSEQVVRLAELVAQRQALFAQAIAQWDALKPVVVAGTAPAPKRKSKTKRRDGDPVVERPCGWDSRLLWSNEELRSWDGKGPEDSEGDVDMDEEERGGMMILSTMCAAGRRCERHQGWQKTLGVALDVEAAQLVGHRCPRFLLTLQSRKKDELDAMVERLTRLEEVEAAGAKAQLVMMATTKLP